MSAEVLCGKYLWAKKNSQNPKARKAPFVQNHLHDAESKWWLLMYFLLTTHPADEPEDVTTAKERARMNTFHVFFPNNLADVRPKLCFNPFHEDELLGRLQDSSVFPDAYTELVNFVVDDLRDMIVQAYDAAEATVSHGNFNTTPMEEIHKKIGKLLATMEDKANAIGRIEYNKGIKDSFKRKKGEVVRSLSCDTVYWESGTQ